MAEACIHLMNKFFKKYNPNNLPKNKNFRDLGQHDTRNFFKLFREKKTTLLAVGPMSKNCVDATIELSNRYNTPIMLIASRRQIDSKDFGGGYVNNWTTETFSSYVKKR